MLDSVELRLMAAALCFTASCCELLSADEPLFSGDHLVDPTGVERSLQVDELPPAPFREYLGEAMRFDFDNPPPTVGDGDPGSDVASDAFEDAIREWQDFKPAELPTQEGAIIFGSPELLFRAIQDPAAFPAKVETKGSRRWPLYAGSAGFGFLLALGVCLLGFRKRWCARERNRRCD